MLDEERVKEQEDDTGVEMGKFEVASLSSFQKTLLATQLATISQITELVLELLQNYLRNHCSHHSTTKCPL